MPVVSNYKWLEPRHMVNVCERWAQDRTDGLQSAFFNGVGYESWENVWGIWNQITPRDAARLRRISLDLPCRAQAAWQARSGNRTCATLQENIYASLFPSSAQALWLLVNRGRQDIRGQQLAVPHRSGARYYDLWHGVELEPSDVRGQRASELRNRGARLRSGAWPTSRRSAAAESRSCSAEPRN